MKKRINTPKKTGLCGPDRSGYTMVELLTVIMVMAILAGIILGAAGYASRKADESKAKADLNLLRGAFEEYRADRGYYPSGDAYTGHINVTNEYWMPVVQVLTNINQDITFTDPWGLGYYYQSVTPQQYRLWSFGPDRSSSNASNRVDDITGL